MRAPSLSWVSRVSLLWAPPLTLALYVALFPVLGSDAARPILALPVILGGAAYGLRGGLAFAALAGGVRGVLQVAFLGTISLQSVLGVLVMLIIAGTVGQLRDTQVRLRAARAAARESERVAKRVLAAVPLSVVTVDRDGRLRSFNRMDAPGAEGSLGRNIEEFVAPGEGARLAAFARAVFEEGREVSYELTATPPGGDAARLFMCTAGPLRDESGAITQMLIVASDITDRRQEEDARHHADKLASLGTLVAGVAHEINNPLTFIRGNVELDMLETDALLAEPETPQKILAVLRERRASQDTVLRGLDQIEHITGSLKRLSRERRDGRAPVDPNDVVDAVTTVLHARRPVHVTLERRLAGTRPVHGDETEIGQVVLNLVMNAIQAVEGRPAGRVSVETRDEGEHVVIEVADDGPGLSEEQLRRLFTPFYTTKPKGTGLGLSISRRIALDHGGDLTAMARPEGGALFRLRLPTFAQDAASRSRDQSSDAAPFPRAG